MMLPYSLYRGHNNLYMKSIRKKVIEWGLSNYVNDIYCIVKTLGIQKERTLNYLVIYPILNNLSENEEIISKRHKTFHIRLGLTFTKTLEERKYCYAFENEDRVRSFMDDHYVHTRDMVDIIFQCRTRNEIIEFQI